MPVVRIDVEHIVAGHDGNHTRRARSAARAFDASDLLGAHMDSRDQSFRMHAGKKQIAGRIWVSPIALGRASMRNILTDGHALPSFNRLPPAPTASMMFQ